jgi:hypothetical protein
LITLAEDDRTRPVVLQLALREDRVQHVVRLVLEKIGGTQEARVDPAGHRAGLYPLGGAARRRASAGRRVQRVGSDMLIFDHFRAGCPNKWWPST